MIYFCNKMETINITINNISKNVQKIMTYNFIFGSSYFDNLIQNMESNVEIDQITNDSIIIFFDFIQNHNRITDYENFIKEYNKYSDQNLYELLIILDYFNSKSLMNIVFEILSSKYIQSDIKKIYLYEHINKIYDNAISKRKIVEIYVEHEQGLIIKYGNIVLLINEPYLISIDEWRTCTNNLIAGKYVNFNFGYVYINYDSINDYVEFYCEVRGGMGGDGYLITHVPFDKFCVSIEAFIKSKEFIKMF